MSGQPAKVGQPAKTGQLKNLFGQSLNSGKLEMHGHPAVW
jgi:hypothetical protein